MRFAVQVSAWVSVFVMAPAWAPAQPNAAWDDFTGLPIVEIRITAHEVFEPEAAKSNLLYGWANALHMRTRTSIIRRELLFAKGERFDPFRVAESARNLRNIGIFQDVVVDVSRHAHGVVVGIVTDDQWATRLITDISSEGSILRLRLGLENSNFLGRAFRLGGHFVYSTDVSAVRFGLSDPRLFGSRWQGGFQYAADDLATLNRAHLRRPFFSELARWTSAFDYTSVRGDRRLFAAGSVTRDTLDIDETFGEAVVALHGHGAVQSRWGLLFSRRSISRDLQHDQAALGLIWSLMQRSYRPLRNIDRYNTQEDIGSGWTVQVGAGADLAALGADTDRPFWRLDAAWAQFVGSSTLLGAAARQHGFVRDRQLENARFLAETWGFWQQADAAVLSWTLGVHALVREPEYMQLTLGGDTRLRGYEARHGVGTRALFMSVEERLFSNVQILFLRLGATVFVDAAQAWSAGGAPRWDAMDVGAGFGLRVGNRKTGRGISRIDFAFGRNNFEISLASGSFFRVARGMEYLSPSLVR